MKETKSETCDQVYMVSVSVVPEVPSTRLHSYLSLLRWSRLPHMMASALGGACVACCVSHFMDQRFYGLTTVVVTADRLVLGEVSGLV